VFLPFTPNGKATELTAIRVKRALGLPAEAAADPYTLLPAVPARVLGPADFLLWPQALRDTLLGETCDGVSGIGFGRSPATGEWVIFVNPNHHRHRQRATLMEEIVHIVLGHPLTELTSSSTRKWKRAFHKDIEDEAYCVGSACIIPYPELFHAIRDRHESVGEIATRYDVSEQYVRYRVNRAGLARVYGKHCP
jgi:hypothetical protein